MKHLLTTLIFLLPLFAAGQEFAVADFALREFDLTAINEATKLVDDNGEDCALIKIETTEKGFFFDGGTIGIAKVDDNHTAEIWLYVPAGLRKITIMHNTFGVIRDYYFPITLVSARTYLMKLKTPDLKSDDKTAELEKKVAEMQQQMQQLMQNQQQGGAQTSDNSVNKTKTTKTTNYPGVIIVQGVLLQEVPKDFQGEFVIGDDIEIIGPEAFWKCSGLTSVTISNSVTYIGGRAFCLCSSLTSVTIPNSVTSIDYMVFAACQALTSISIPNSVTSIAKYAFYNCQALTSITFQGTNTGLNKDAFKGCEALQTIYVPKGSRAYYESQLPKKLRSLIVEQ